MTNGKAKWLMYTVLVGLIPVILRLLIWAISQNRDDMDMLNTADLVVFGLILHISIINQIERFGDGESLWRTILNGTSFVSITGYGLLFAAYLLDQSNPGLINQEAAKYLAISFSLVSFIIGFSVYNKISKPVEVHES